MTTNITEELRTKLLESGATLVGFANMRSADTGNLPYAACVLIALPPAVVNDISEAPTVEYWNTYNSVNSLLDEIVKAGANFLRGKGYSALPVTRESAVWDAKAMRTDYPYKTVATRAEAILGATWAPAMERELLVDTSKCMVTMRKRMKQLNGFEASICGKCFAVCPYTKKYLRKYGY